jgi:hypothetical protein
LHLFLRVLWISPPCVNGIQILGTTVTHCRCLLIRELGSPAQLKHSQAGVRGCHFGSESDQGFNRFISDLCWVL